MIIVKSAVCPVCEHGLKISVRQLPKQMYAVLYFDGRDKNARSSVNTCPRCRIDLFQSEVVKTLTGLDLLQLSR